MTTARALWTRAVLANPCPACGAAPGARCVTTTGRNKFEPHADRSHLASVAHWRAPDEDEEDDE